MILAILQARMSSQRLPGKVLMEIAGKPMLQWVIEAAQAAKTVDRVLVATSDSAEDMELFKSVNSLVDVYRGDLNDVLGRFYKAALYYKPSHIVRLTGDCPMMRPEIIDKVVQHHLTYNRDYTTNRPYYPSGLDVEAFTMNTLVKTAKLASDPYDREHVTPYMKERARFDVGKVAGYERNPGEKLSVDTQEELEKVRKLMGEKQDG